MGRKGQVKQVFIYIMAILVIGFLILFGYQMIDKLLNQQCEVADQQFMTRLQDDLDDSVRYLSRTNSVLHAPCDFHKLCFVNAPNVTGESDLGSDIETDYPMIWANTRDGIEYNVYLIDESNDGVTTPVLFDERIRTINPEDGSGEELLCINSTNKQFSFWMEGYGKNGIYLYDG
ncbi:MAG: hypothetical protein ACLFO2_00460 [Candidatus Woesearchaeota archaeon]